MNTKHTPGPWFADSHGNIWRRHPSDLCQNGGGVAGDKPLARASQGWYGENDAKFPAEANARLIARSPDMYALLKELIDIEGPQPGTAQWADKVFAVLAAVEGKA